MKTKGSRNKGEKNANWKGDSVGLNALHGWAKRRIAKPSYCNRCHENKSLDLANISQEYKRDLSDWEWLCRKCHMESDGRMNNLKRNKRLENKNCVLCNKNFKPKRPSTKYCSQKCYFKSGTMGISKRNDFKYIGVTFNKKSSKWYAQIGKNYKKIHIGSFLNVEDAAKAYDRVAQELHGHNAILNFSTI